MTKTRITAATAVAFALSIAQASATVISSTFDTGDDGWHAYDPTGDYTSTWHSSGGNPDGFLDGIETDPQGGVGYFIAPSKFLGNLSAYAGGTLTYDFKVIVGADYNYFDAADVIISNGATSVSWDPNINPVGYGWYTFQVQLTEANFGSNLAFILSNVTELQIRGEFISYSEEEGLDNVLLATPSQTPLPAALPLFATGLGGLGLLGWRRKRKNTAALAAA